MLIINNRVELKKWLDNHALHKGVINPDCNKAKIRKKYVYIDCIFTDYMAAFLPRFIYAKGLKDRHPEYELVAICDKKEADVNAVSECYGIRTLNLRGTISMIKALLMALIVFIFWNNSKSIYSLSFRNVEIGKYLADYLIRRSDDLFSVEQIRFRDLKHVSVFYWKLIEVDKIFRKAPPDMYLVLETGYWYGPVIKMAENYGARIVQCLSGSKIMEIGKKINIPINSIDSWNYGVHKGVEKIEKDGIDYISWADDYYKRRRLGLTDRDATDAYANKIILTRDEWAKQSLADKNKKNIVIMAHCFSDDANTTTSRSIYRDYYKWLIRTLEIIQQVDNVNWLLRAHPGRGVYNEGNRIYEIFEKYAQKDNIFILADDISSESLYNIIDGAVTVLGTCGLEFSSFGIPVVCAGLASYGGFGFTMEPQNEKEYIKYLSSMDQVSRLSEEKIDVARKVSYAYFNLRNPADKLDQIFENSLMMSKNIASDYVIEKMNKLDDEGFWDKDSFFYKKASYNLE